MPTPNRYAEFMSLITGYRVSQAIYVAATLGIADLLKDGPRTCDSLAAATNTHPRTLYRLMRALAAGGGYFTKTAANDFPSHLRGNFFDRTLAVRRVRMRG